MDTIGAFDAKTHLAALLDRVAQGEEIVITRRGIPVARLVPARPARDERAIRAALERMDARRRGLRLAGLRIDELIDEGRR